MIAPNAVGNAGPQEHEDVDQPHVVGLPHRADAAVDLVAQRRRRGGRRRRAGPRSRCRSRRRRTARRRSRRRTSARAIRSTRLIDPILRPASIAHAAGGLYGVGRSMSPVSRHRRAIERSTTAAAMPIAAYTMSITAKLIQIPPLLGDRVLDAHDAEDDPRLAADLGGDPPGLERDDARARRPAPSP